MFRCLVKISVLMAMLPLLGLSAQVQADPAVRQPQVLETLPLAVEHPGWQLEWNNQAPHQRQALDQFYQSLQITDQPLQRLQRQRHIQQLQSMTPQERQQRFHEFVQSQRTLR